jgi:hypothetical protein
MKDAKTLRNQRPLERAMGIETIPVVATVSIDVANDDNYSITENTSLYV